MQLVDSKIYPDGSTYSGDAVNEVDHMEFLKITNYSDAISNIYTAVEGATTQKGYTLLTVDIYYEEGIAYHMFDVDYKYTQMATMSIDGTIQQMILPVIIEALLPIITIIVYGLVGYILLNTLTKSVTTMFYNPVGTSGEGGGSSILTYAVIFVAGAYLINALTGISREIRR